MNTAKMKAHLPTFSGYLEKRKKAKQNRLPKHLRPPEIWPLWIQIVLNRGLIVALVQSDGGPGRFHDGSGPGDCVGHLFHFCSSIR